MNDTKQNIIVGAAIVIAFAVVIFGLLVLQKLERTVQVAERTEEKLNRIMEATAPLGDLAIEKGSEIVTNLDDEELARSAEEGIREIGTATKSKLIEWIATQRVSHTNDGVVGNLDITVTNQEEAQQ
jgi:hypothetical protein